MRGFLSSIIGASMIITLLFAYSAWYQTKDTQKAFSSYLKLNHDVYERAKLEDAVYDLLKANLITCKGILAKGGSLSDCSTIVNTSLKALYTSYRIPVPPPGNIVEPVLKPDLRFVVVYEVRGKIGTAEYRLPLGAEVGG